jgi:hypothetical protein
MTAREEHILDHLGRYTITLKRVLDEIYFDGSSSQNVIGKLIREKLVESHPLDGKFRYYQLSIAGARSRGVPVNRAREKDPKGIASDLAALWFSTMGSARRKRLTDKDLRLLFGAPKGGNVIHVAQVAESDTTVFRLYIPTDVSLLRSVVATLKKTAHDVAGDERLLPWVERGTYQLAVLVHNENRREELREMILKETFPEVRIQLDVAPTPANLIEFISPERDEATA